MNNREEFETLFLILYKKWREWGKHTTAYGVGWDIWQGQQKIIDELNLKLAIKDDMITALNLTIDELKSQNPDVPCPACGGSCEIMVSGDVYFGEPDKMPATCKTCKGNGTVSTVKALQYDIEQLKKEMKDIWRC